MRMLKVTLAVGAWIFWPVAAAGIAVCFRAMFDAIEQRTRRPIRPVRYIGVDREPDAPRTIHVTTAHGVVTLRPTTEPVVRQDGSDWR